MIKTIKLKDELHQRLSLLKSSLGVKKIEETIEFLLEVFELDNRIGICEQRLNLIEEMLKESGVNESDSRKIEE